MTKRRGIDRALAAWRRRELQFPPFVRRMTPDALDFATGAYPPSTYTISADGHAITCGVCGLTSYHPRDVSERFCGHCHVFHEG